MGREKHAPARASLLFITGAIDASQILTNQAANLQSNRNIAYLENIRQLDMMLQSTRQTQDIAALRHDDGSPTETMMSDSKPIFSPPDRPDHRIPPRFVRPPLYSRTPAVQQLQCLHVCRQATD
ncbi:hypothetical protein EJ03DRAFT_65924 [Teratosphaeria nubilosa]|uniref:Uncharacterized protein n=1 Tax=Teratosphaeria nubilosa TaxID=161662 RepID=A0A6G1LCH6_9PEZI|nr:hypothetical protein EJ03DRAFT_65924 [Teratosphaeria nubilosa]